MSSIVCYNCSFSSFRDLSLLSKSLCIEGVPFWEGQGDCPLPAPPIAHHMWLFLRDNYYYPLITAASSSEGWPPLQEQAGQQANENSWFHVEVLGGLPDASSGCFQIQARIPFLPHGQPGISHWAYYFMDHPSCKMTQSFILKNNYADLGEVHRLWAPGVPFANGAYQTCDIFPWRYILLWSVSNLIHGFESRAKETFSM